MFQMSFNILNPMKMAKMGKIKEILGMSLPQILRVAFLYVGFFPIFQLET